MTTRRYLDQRRLRLPLLRAAVTAAACSRPRWSPASASPDLRHLLEAAIHRDRTCLCNNREEKHPAGAGCNYQGRQGNCLHLLGYSLPLMLSFLTSPEQLLEFGAMDRITLFPSC